MQQEQQRKQGTKTKADFENAYMTFAEYGLYRHLRRISHGNRPQYHYRFDDRAIASQFANERGVSKDAANRLRQSLAEKGFIVWAGKQERKPGGQYAPRVGRILSFEEWKASPKGKRIYTPSALAGLQDALSSPVANSHASQSQVQGGAEPVQSQITGGQSQTGPVQSERTDVQSQTPPVLVAFGGVHLSRQLDINRYNPSEYLNSSSNSSLNGFINECPGLESSSEAKPNFVNAANHEGTEAAPCASSVNATGEDFPVEQARQEDSDDWAIPPGYELDDVDGVVGYFNCHGERFIPAEVTA